MLIFFLIRIYLHCVYTAAALLYFATFDLKYYTSTWQFRQIRSIIMTRKNRRCWLFYSAVSNRFKQTVNLTPSTLGGEKINKMNTLGALTVVNLTPPDMYTYRHTHTQTHKYIKDYITIYDALPEIRLISEKRRRSGVYKE